MDKLTTDSIFNNEEDDFLDDMVALQMLENMEYHERSSRKRKYADLDDDNEEDDDEEDDNEEDDDEEDDDEEDDDEEDEEDNDIGEEEDEEDNDIVEEEYEEDDVSEQSSASYASDARSPTNLADPFAGLEVPTMENDIKVLRAVLDKMRHPPSFMKIARETLCELNSKLVKETTKLNGGTIEKL